MNNADFLDLLERVRKETFDLLESKGKEYSGPDDRLANFKRGAAAVGVQPTTVLYVYLSKHLDAISTYIKMAERGAAPTLSEPIEGRINDAINYLVLLRGLVEEGRSSRNAEEEALIELDFDLKRPRMQLQGADAADFTRLVGALDPCHTVVWAGEQVIAYRVAGNGKWINLQ